MNEDANPLPQPTEPEPSPPRNIPTTRLVVNESIYHQIGNEDPQADATGFVRWLRSDEQIYHPKRVIKVRQDWQSIDTGWIHNVSMLVIKNETPKIKQQSESLQDRQGVLEVSMNVVQESVEDGVGMWTEQKTSNKHYPDFIILPGESLRGTPTNVEAMAIRCREGEGRYSVIVVDE